MATTFLGAVKDRYASIVDAPTLWTCRIPEGTGFPQALLEHDGETWPAAVYQSDGEGGVEWAGKSANGCRLTLYGLEADELDLLAQSVLDRFDPNGLPVAGRVVNLMRVSYRLTDDPARSQEGRIVFKAVLVYTAEVD